MSLLDVSIQFHVALLKLVLYVPYLYTNMYERSTSLSVFIYPDIKYLFTIPSFPCFWICWFMLPLRLFAFVLICIKTGRTLGTESNNLNHPCTPVPRTGSISGGYGLYRTDTFRSCSNHHNILKMKCNPKSYHMQWCFLSTLPQNYERKG